MAVKFDYLSPEGFRLDGRRKEEIRRIEAKVGSVPSADGSSFLRNGNTRILAVVYGPREPSEIINRDEERATIVVNFENAFRKTKRKYSNKTEEFCSLIKKTLESTTKLELYPRTQIDLHLTVLEEDGSVLSVAMNASCLAFIHAGIEMPVCFVACSVIYISDSILVDPNRQEEDSCSPILTTVSLPNDLVVTSTLEPGSIYQQTLLEMCLENQRTAKNLIRIFRETVFSELNSF